MSKSLILTVKAQDDLDKAFQWYEKQVSGLGNDFIQSVDKSILEIKRNPQHHQTIHLSGVRRAVIKRFPFSIYFVENEDAITIFALIHQKRNPEFWKARI